MRTSIELLKSHICNNIQSLQKIYSKVGCVLKANAYGHGFNVLWNEFLTMSSKPIIFLAHLDELKNITPLKDFRIVIMSPSFLYAEEVLFFLNIYQPEITLYDEVSLDLFLKLKNRLNYNPAIHIKIDVGLNRLGFLIEDIDHLLKICKKEILNIVGVFSHCSESNQYNTILLDQQTDVFNKALKKIKIEYPFIESHLYSSGGVDRKHNFDLCRSGSFVYGLWKSLDQKKRFMEVYPDLLFKQIMRWKTNIIQIKNVQKGSFVGYGKYFKAERDMKIAILPVGYEDGYDRNFAEKSSVVINGIYAPLCGAISMNLMTVDVTNIQCQVGDIVLLTDPDYEKIRLDYLGGLLNMQGITLSSRISSSIHRSVVDE